MKNENSPWRIEITKQPAKILRRLPQNVGKRLDKAILALADNPQPIGSKKLTDYPNLYRVRVGDWRIIYAIEDEKLIILIIRIAPRGNAYRDLG